MEVPATVTKPSMRPWVLTCTYVTLTPALTLARACFLRYRSSSGDPQEKPEGSSVSVSALITVGGHQVLEGLSGRTGVAYSLDD